MYELHKTTGASPSRRSGMGTVGRNPPRMDSGRMDVRRGLPSRLGKTRQ